MSFGSTHRHTCSPPAFLRHAQQAREWFFVFVCFVFLIRDRQLVFFPRYTLQVADESSQSHPEPAFWKSRNNSAHFQIDKSHLDVLSPQPSREPRDSLLFLGLALGTEFSPSTALQLRFWRRSEMRPAPYNVSKGRFVHW